MTPLGNPALIGLDWGTSSLRGYLLGADGTVLERVADARGVRQVTPGGFAAAFRETVGAWCDRWPGVPVLAAGMVGSRQGWREVDYVDCPADAPAIARGIVPFDGGAGLVHLVPGVIQRDDLPNVLRGEETQIVGALALDPALARASLCVLPGTHSKWVVVREGRLVRFDTYLTGELFAVLRDHSLLGMPAREAGIEASAGPAPGAAFERGLAVARDSGAEGVAGRLFSARSLFLTGALPASATLDYLSGLLVGEEVRAAVAGLRGPSPPPLALIGTPDLCERYRAAFAAFGIDRVHVMGDSAAAGLWEIARAAGLVSARTSPAKGPTHV